MKITPKTREQLATENLIPEGNHEVVVEGAEDKVSSNDNEMIELKLRVYLPDNRERVASDWLLESFGAKLLDFVEAAGLEKHYNAGTLTARDCIGHSLLATFVHRTQKKGEYAGQVQSSVTGYAKLVRQASPGGKSVAPKPRSVPPEAVTADIKEDDIPF